MKKLQNLLKKKIVILDGAMGTQLQQAGLPHGASPELWASKHPAVLGDIHRRYAAAGSDIVYACTFGANLFKLKEYGYSSVRPLNKRLALIARESVPRKTLVAGDIGPTGQFVEPFGKLAFDEAVAVYKEQVKGLLDGGVDLFVIETMMDIQEARAALIAVKELTDLFTIVTMTYEASGRTLNGTDPLTALITLQSLGADAVGCNCSAGPRDMVPWIKAMKPYAHVPLVAKPNAGIPTLVKGVTQFSLRSKPFGTAVKKLASSGVNFLGGCCGTTPEHIQALSDTVCAVAPEASWCKAISALSGARGHIILRHKKPLVVVGECINPTGKKSFQRELLKGTMSTVRTLAKEQAADGAQVLDVNAGVPGGDEPVLLNRMITLLSVANNLPLVIDSSNVIAIEKALRIYPGRALLNSVSGETKKLKKLLPLAAKYGAMIIVLPLTEKGIPKTVAERKKVIGDICRAAKAEGFHKEDMVIDGMVMAVASRPRGALDTLETIEWANNSRGMHTIVGLSNVSFGMPQRGIINATFLGIARAKGLSMAIAHPRHMRVERNKYARAFLLGRKDGAVKFIEACAGEEDKVTKKVFANDAYDKQIYTAVLDGNRDDIKCLVKQAIDVGFKADDLVQKTMLPALTKTGELFDAKKYFLPQLVASAETMKRGFQALEPYLTQKDVQHISRTVIVLATVQGDIHDIGKNIIALMLKNHGFSVVDLGKDVSALRIVEAAKKHKAAIVGLSALMTTTMVNMPEVIQNAQKKGLTCRFVVGGAVITESYAQEIGASYAKDGVEAVRIVKGLSASC